MMKTLIAAAAALALMTPLCVHAATPADRAPAAAAAPAANPEAEALVRRYLAAVHFERTMDSMQAAMLPVIAAQTARSNNLTADDQKMVVDIVRQVMRDKMMPKMIERMVPIYAQTFTLAELQAMVSFYESPTGRAITDKFPTLAPRSAAITRELMPEMMGEVMREIIARKCPNGSCQPATPKGAAS